MPLRHGRVTVKIAPRSSWECGAAVVPSRHDLISGGCVSNERRFQEAFLIHGQRQFQSHPHGAGGSALTPSAPRPGRMPPTPARPSPSVESAKELQSGRRDPPWIERCAGALAVSSASSATPTAAAATVLSSVLRSGRATRSSRRWRGGVSWGAGRVGRPPRLRRQLPQPL